MPDKSQKLKTLHCHSCGVTFGTTEFFDQSHRENRLTFYCPNGHALCYSANKTHSELQTENETLKTENADLKKQVIALLSKIDQLEAQVRKL